MSEDALNTAIAAKWESAGLDAGVDDLEVPDATGEDEVAPVEDDGEVVDTPADDAVDTSTEETTETTEETDPPEVDAAAAAATKEAQDELAEALGLGKPPADPKKRAAWWKSRLPYSQVHKIVTEREKKLTDSHTSAIKGYTDKISERDGRFADVQKVEDLIKDKPEQYINTLAEIFPDTYGKLFAPIRANGKVAAPLAEVTDPGPRPEPDYELPDGSKTYSLEGLQKRMEWEQKVTEQKMLERFKPHLDYVQQQQTAAEKKAKADLAEEQKKQGLQSANDAIAEVETWDMGKENIKAIVDLAATLPETYDAEKALNIAYRRIVMPLMKADRDKMTVEIMKGLKKTSNRQTAVGLTQTKTATTSAASTTSLDDRIKAGWKQKGLI